MKQGDLVRVIKNDMSLAYNARTKMKDRKFFHRVGIILDIYVNAIQQPKWKSLSGVEYMWYDVYFGSCGIYHIREDTMVVESESR